MGIVNADSESLLTALQNMRTAISSIESTKRTILQKYQQLGKVGLTESMLSLEI